MLDSGAGTGLCWTEWHWDRFVLDRVALGQVCVGQSGTGTGLCWTEWQWDRFVVDGMALGQVFFPPSASAFRYRSTSAPYSDSFACSCYRKDKRAKHGGLQTSSAISEIWLS